MFSISFILNPPFFTLILISWVFNQKHLSCMINKFFSSNYGNLDYNVLGVWLEYFPKYLSDSISETYWFDSVISFGSIEPHYHRCSELWNAQLEDEPSLSVLKFVFITKQFLLSWCKTLFENDTIIAIREGGTSSLK